MSPSKLLYMTILSNYLPTFYLPNYLPTYPFLPVYLPFPTSLCTVPSIYSSTHPPTDPPTQLPSYLPTPRSTYLPYLPTLLPTYLIYQTVSSDPDSPEGHHPRRVRKRESHLGFEETESLSSRLGVCRSRPRPSSESPECSTVLVGSVL